MVYPVFPVVRRKKMGKRFARHEAKTSAPPEKKKKSKILDLAAAQAEQPGTDKGRG